MFNKFTHSCPCSNYPVTIRTINLILCPSKLSDSFLSIPCRRVVRIYTTSYFKLCEIGNIISFIFPFTSMFHAVFGSMKNLMENYFMNPSGKGSLEIPMRERENIFVITVFVTKTQRFRSGFFVPTNAELNILHFLFIFPNIIQPNTDFIHLLSNIIESIDCCVSAGKGLGNQRIDVS